jgi:2-polyprenyl-3-methyl-5-hydroxy-6-metoxy-1,4-benzoquinol methylase
MKSSAWNNRDKIELRRCAQCRFVFSPVSICNYHEAKNKFADKSQEELLAVGASQGLPQLVNEIIQKTKLTQGDILDFGCGIGLAALSFQCKGFKTYGIETSRVCLEKHTQLNITSASTLEAFAVRKNSFDLITIKDVLEHVDNPKELLHELVSYVRPGGYFYIRVPNVYHYSFHWSIDTRSHINHFTPRQLMQLLEANNLRLVDFIKVYDISTRAGRLYNAVFWPMRRIVPMYHQISFLCQKH